MENGISKKISFGMDNQVERMGSSLLQTRYDHGHKILIHFDVKKIFHFTTSQTKHDY